MSPLGRETNGATKLSSWIEIMNEQIGGNSHLPHTKPGEYIRADWRTDQPVSGQKGPESLKGRAHHMNKIGKSPSNLLLKESD